MPFSLPLPERMSAPGSTLENSPEAVALHRPRLAEELAADPAFLAPLLGATALGCWCPLDGPCHADVLIEVPRGRAAR